MSYLDWKVGDKIVCIADQDRIDAVHATVPGSIYPQSGKVYTIREMRDDSQWHSNKVVVLLKEIDNSHLLGAVLVPGTKCYVEPGFNPNGFRPVQPRKTSIEVFQRIRLNPSIRIREDA
jgi:hypothetical protein